MPLYYYDYLDSKPQKNNIFSTQLLDLVLINYGLLLEGDVVVVVETSF